MEEVNNNAEHIRHLQEREETNRVIQKGLDFSIRDQEIKVEKRWFGLVRKKRLLMWCANSTSTN